MNISSEKSTLSILKEITFLESFTDDELNNLIQLGVTSQVEAHSNVIIEGESSWGLYIILSGLVGIYKKNKLTKSQFDIGQLRAGSFFGEMSLIDGDPRSATVRTLTSSQLFYISKDSFQSFITHTSDLESRFYSSCIKTLVKRLRELNDDYVVSQYQLWQVALKKEVKLK